MTWLHGFFLLNECLRFFSEKDGDKNLAKEISKRQMTFFLKDSMMAPETCSQILATKLLCYLSNNVAKTCSRGSKFSRELKSSTLSSFIKYSLRIFSCIYVLHAFPNFLYTGVFCVKKTCLYIWNLFEKFYWNKIN